MPYDIKTGRFFSQGNPAGLGGGLIDALGPPVQGGTMWSGGGLGGGFPQVAAPPPMPWMPDRTGPFGLDLGGPLAGVPPQGVPPQGTPPFGMPTTGGPPQGVPGNLPPGPLRR
jgi:hypothetical protein